jgi:hypothetical protein
MITHQVLNPYVGPRPFQRGETLYGRNHELMNLLNLIIAERIVMFYSPSGAGKTSLLQASLFPRLEKKKFRLPASPMKNAHPSSDANRCSVPRMTFIGGVRKILRRNSKK